MKNRRRQIFRILVILWMVLIFAFSAQPADQSTEISLGVGKAVGKVLIRDFEQLSAARQTAYAEDIDFVVRKTAHAAEYAVLGILFMFALGNNCVRWRPLVSFLCTVLYAASDEFHQRFVPGRSGQIRDVLIDSAGAAAGVLLFAGIAAWRKRRNKNAVNSGDKSCFRKIIRR